MLRLAIDYLECRDARREFGISKIMALNDWPEWKVLAPRRRGLVMHSIVTIRRETRYSVIKREHRYLCESDRRSIGEMPFSQLTS